MASARVEVGQDLETLPILDLSQLDQGEAARAAFLAQLRQVTHEVGFFYLVGHGIPQAGIDGIFEEARRSFALPLADRMQIEMVNSPHVPAYSPIGGGSR